MPIIYVRWLNIEDFIVNRFNIISALSFNQNMRYKNWYKMKLLIEEYSKS